MPEGDFQLSARVTAGLASTFGAGVLLLWLDERRWGKLCFEFSPAGEGQSPTGGGCSVTFDQIRFLPERLAGLRDGS